MRQLLLAATAVGLLWPVAAPAHIPEGCRQSFTQMKEAVLGAEYDHKRAAEAGKALSALRLA